MHRLSLVAASVIFTLTSPALAQTTFEDFNGASVDPARWFRYGELSRITQSQGSLRFRGAGARENQGMVAISAIQGTFDVTVDFAAFQANSTKGEPAFNMYVFDAVADLDKGGELRLGLEATARGNQWILEAELAGKNIGFRQISTRATAGKLRIARSNGRVAAWAQERGSTNWTQVAQLSDFFTSKTVRLVLESGAGDNDAPSVACDKVTLTGSTVTGSPGFGRRCFDLGNVATTLPKIGNPLALLCLGRASFVKAPFAIALGARQLAIDLGAAGAPGCALHASLDFLFVGGILTDEAQGRILLPIPATQSLIGVKFHTQMIATTRGNRMGIAWSNGVTSTITR